MRKQLWNWVILTGWKNFEGHAGNMDVKDNSGEMSDENKEHVIGSWRKGSYKLAKNLSGLCSGVLWKPKLVSNEIDI